MFKLFWIWFVSLVKFSYWSKFHVNIATGSGVMTIYFYKGLTRNPEIGNTPVWVLPNIWRLGQCRHTKFRTDVSKKMLLNATKYQGYSFYRFWVIKGIPTGGGKIIPPPLPPHRSGLRIKVSVLNWSLTSPFFFEGKRTWLNHAFKNFKLKCTSGRKQLH